ncbi:MAG: hypothetical protein ACKVZJ_07285 [Phycisphaerales bacterium]
MIVYFASDLLWASKIKATADAIGVPARPVRDTTMLDARLADSDVRGLLLDLDAPERAFELLGHLRVRQKEPEMQAKLSAVRVCAFGPHVNVTDLERAMREGCDPVLTRGAMDRSMERVLRLLEGTE